MGIAGVANAFRSSGVLRFGESYSITLSTVGEITYFDTFHPSIMVGTIDVFPADAGSVGAVDNGMQLTPSLAPVFINSITPPPFRQFSHSGTTPAVVFPPPPTMAMLRWWTPSRSMVPR